MSQKEAYAIIEEVFSSSLGSSYSDIKDLCRTRIDDVDIFNKMFQMYEIVDIAAELFRGTEVDNAWLQERGILDEEDFRMYYEDKCKHIIY